MAWTNLSFPFGSLLSSTKMTQLDANIDAVASGDDGAPAIQYGCFLFEGTMGTSTNSTYVTVASYHMYFPTAVNTWNLAAQVRTDNNIRVPHSRIKIGNSFSDDAVATAPASSWQVSSCAMDVASINGWQTVNVQVAATTAAFDNVFSRYWFGYYT
jgi:hypothetical protein